MLLPRFQRNILRPSARPLINSLKHLSSTLNCRNNDYLCNDLKSITPRGTPSRRNNGGVTHTIRRPQLRQHFCNVTLTTTNHTRATCMTSTTSTHRTNRGSLQHCTNRPDHLYNNLLNATRAKRQITRRRHNLNRVKSSRVHLTTRAVRDKRRINPRTTMRPPSITRRQIRSLRHTKPRLGHLLSRLYLHNIHRVTQMSTIGFRTRPVVVFRYHKAMTKINRLDQNTWTPHINKRRYHERYRNLRARHQRRQRSSQRHHPTGTQRIVSNWCNFQHINRTTTSLFVF